MSRGGQKRQTDEPERRCIVTRETQPKSGLIRFVVGPDAQLVPDVAGKLPGRGMWVAADAGSLEKATGKGHFQRAAGAPVSVPGDLVQMIERLLVGRLTDALSLARKAGQAVAGFEKVRDMLDKQEARVLFQAEDGSDNQKRKLWTPEGGRWFGCLTARELGVAFGRETVVHAALRAGGLADHCVSEAARLNGLRAEKA